MTRASPAALALASILLTLSPAAHPQVDLVSGLELSIDFEGDFQDRSANGYHGQDVGGITLSPGIVGTSGFFDGVDDRLLFPDFPDELIATGDFTIAFWFKTPEGAIRSIVAKRGACQLAPFIDIRMATDRRMNLEVSDSIGRVTVTTVATDETWHHAAFTRSNRTLRSFLDGQAVGQLEMPGDFDFTNDVTLGVGNSACVGLDGTQPMQGGMDDLRIYSRALKDAEVHRLFVIFVDSFEPENPGSE
jgi:hypothetical protein